MFSINSMIILIILTISFYENVNSHPSGRIVGGYDATSRQFPHQISLRFNHLHNCGGSILSNKFVLTAAHCVVANGIEPYDAKNFTIRAGTNNRIAGGVIVQVKRVIVNQEYGNFLNDVALLELEEELKLSDAIKPIDIATEEVPAGEEVIISGWGLLVTAGDNLPIALQWNKVEAISKLKCASKILFYEDSIICLNHPSGAGACNGDSGGPAVYDGKLVGVAGFVVGGCGTSNPDGYAKVSYHVDWIHENMQESV